MDTLDENMQPVAPNVYMQTSTVDDQVHFVVEVDEDGQASKTTPKSTQASENHACTSQIVN